MALTLIIGEQHHRLTAVCTISQRMQDGRLAALWKCECGRERAAPIGRVRAGLITSCGCDTKEKMRRGQIVHGGHGAPEYSSWGSMKDRCLNPDSKDFARYGARGITIHPEWIDSFEAFYQHIGPRPEGTTLDRIDNRNGYVPGNVRWATSSVQQTNRADTWSVEIDGVTYPSMEAAGVAHGVSAMTIKRWCDGYADKRRADQQNRGYTPPRPNCRKWRKYDA